MNETGWNDVFMRPCVAADSHWCLRVDLEAEKESGVGQKLLYEILHVHRKDAMVQRFNTDILEKGEWSVMFFNKQYSHGVNKTAKENGDKGFLEGFNTKLLPVPDKVIEVATKAVTSIAGCVLYARVDVMEAGDVVVLVELELIEPSLFLGHHPDAAKKLASAVLKVLHS